MDQTQAKRPINKYNQTHESIVAKMEVLESGELIVAMSDIFQHVHERVPQTDDIFLMDLMSNLET